MEQRKFENLEVWQESRCLVKAVYTFTSQLRDYDFNSQIRRAVVSIMNNIAEGSERNTKQQFISFLNIAKGSCGEVRSMLYVAKDLQYISEQQFNELYQQANILSRKIQSLSNYLSK